MGTHGQVAVVGSQKPQHLAGKVFGEPSLRPVCLLAAGRFFSRGRSASRRQLSHRQPDDVVGQRFQRRPHTSVVDLGALDLCRHDRFRPLCRVDGFEITMGHLHLLDQPGAAEAFQPHVEIECRIGMAVDGKEGERPAILGMDGRDIEIRNLVLLVAVIGRAVDHELQRCAAPITGGVVERIIDRLAPGSTAVLGHDRRNDVDELGDAGDAHPVGTADEGVEDTADLQHVLEIIDVFEQMRRVRPLVARQDLLVLLVGMVPDVPFVEGNADRLLRAFLRLDIVNHAADRGDIAVELGRPGEIVERILLAVGEIHVQRDVVGAVVALLEDLGFPIGIGLHVGIRRAADHEFERLVEAAHRLGRLVGQPAVFIGRLVADLPGAVHLVAEAPQFHIVRIGPAVLAAQIRPIGAAGMIAIFQEVAGGIETAGAEIDGEHRLGIGLLAPVDEFVDADLVGFTGAPGKVEANRALRTRADAIFPIVSRDEVAAGVTAVGRVELADELEHVAAKSVLVGCGMSGLIDAAVDRSAEMLEKRAVEPGINGRDAEIAVGNDIRLQRILPFMYQEFCFLAFNLISGMSLCQPTPAFNHTIEFSLNRRLVSDA
ncbi:hypothetical protein RHECNPAF_1260048 [Rhizobium etli CNPAF512]|nr:hypothetical protein RHECNPAF_1260048 [Rhizobium etli CNPAF512]